MKQVSRKRDHDEHVIETVVRRFGPVSRVGIHKLTNLRRTTISTIVRNLLGKGRLQEIGRSNNRLGRKQILLQLNEEYGYIVTVEFDDEKIRAGVLDLHPRLKHMISEPTDLGGGSEGLIAQLKACVRRVIQEAGVGEKSVVGLGIADPGFVDSRNGVTLTCSIIEFWKQVPLKRIFEDEFRFPVIVESKTRARTIAEQMLGAGETQQNLIYIDYGTGIGAGIIVDGRILYGNNCGVGELGHTHIIEDGPTCKCGSIGCLEAIAGATAFESRIHKALADGAVSEILTLAGGDVAKTNVWLALTAANAGDKVCSNITTQIARYLGIGIANLVNLFNPAVIVFDKRLEMAGSQLLDEIYRTIRAQALTSSSSSLTLRFAKIGEEAGLLGAGLAVLEKHFEIPALRPPTFMVQEIGREEVSATNVDLIPSL